MSTALITAGLLSILFALYVFRSSTRSQISTREPPTAYSRLGPIGHTLGLTRENGLYWTRIRSPIYTVDLWFFRAYVVSDPQWLREVARNRHIQFYPFITESYKYIAEIPASKLELFYDPPRGKGLAKMTPANVTNSLNAQHTAAISIIALNSMSKVVSATFEHGETKVISLSSWIRHLMAFASCEAVYGRKHPFTSPEVEESFWQAELLFRSMFTWFGRLLYQKKCRHHRDVFARYMENYYSNGGLDDASQLARSRHEFGARQGFSNLEIARMETPMTLAFVGGTPGVAFYLLYEIISRPTLLQEVRDELELAVAQQHTATKVSFDLNMHRVKELCPIFFSTYQETLRIRSTFTAHRFVTSDTTVSCGGESYQLKANQVMLLPSHAVNHSSTAWGKDANEFNPKRFLNYARNEQEDRSRFRAFGGAPTLCPGRHFGTTEVLAVAAMLLVRFDMAPLDQSLWTKASRQDVSRIFQGVAPPVKDIEVSFTPRKGWQGNWTVQVGGDRLKWDLVVN